MCHGAGKCYSQTKNTVFKVGIGAYTDSTQGEEDSEALIWAAGAEFALLDADGSFWSFKEKPRISPG